MLSTIKTIRENLNKSNEVKEQLSYMRSRKNSLYHVQADMIEEFFADEFHDTKIANTLEKLINSKEETEAHNIIAALSYIIPNYGIKLDIPYDMHVLNIALAGMIVTEYIRIKGARPDTTYKLDSMGRRYSIETEYIEALNHQELEKNVLEGIHTIPGKILKKYRKTKPGSPALKLDKQLKKVAKAVSSMPLRVVQDITPDDAYELLLKGDDYKQAVKGETQEHRIAMQERFKWYSKMFKMVQEDCVNGIPNYLSVNFDYRGRMYYDLTFVLLNPQSKIGKFMWEAYTSRRLNAKDYKAFCFAAVSTVSRCNRDKAVELFETDEDNIRKELLEENSFLDLVYNKRLLKAIDDYRNGVKSRFLLMLDYTTGGLIHFSSGYTRELKSMKLANIIKGEALRDTHGEVAKTVKDLVDLDISRKDAKVINQGILAGISSKSAANKFNEYFNKDVITSVQIEEIGTKVYGKTYELFHKFNLDANALFDNFNSSCKWTTKDNVKCLSSAYIKGQEVSVFVPRIGHKSNKKITIHRDMPMKLDNITGTALTVGNHATSKQSGGLANITHSVDGTSIRANILTMYESDEVGIFVHDNIATAGSVHEDIILPTAQKDIIDNFNDQVMFDYYQQACSNRKGRVIRPINRGVNDIDTFEVSSNFMQA